MISCIPDGDYGKNSQDKDNEKHIMSSCIQKDKAAGKSRRRRMNNMSRSQRLSQQS